ALTVNAGLLRHFRFEPTALLIRIGELAEAIGQLDTAQVELKALGDTRIVARRPGQRGLAYRVFVENCRAGAAEMRLDQFNQAAAEDVGPGVVGGHTDAGLAGRRGERITSRNTIRGRRQKIDPGAFKESLRTRQPLRARRGRNGNAAMFEAGSVGSFGGYL